MGGVYPKSAMELAGKPIIAYIVENLANVKPSVTKIILVVGYGADIVERAVLETINLDCAPELKFVLQKVQLGTAHALSTALPHIKKTEANILVMCGDTPFIRGETMSGLIRYHQEQNGDITLLTAEMDNPSSYGRIIRDPSGAVAGIIEYKDATPEQRDIKEVNSGFYILRLSVVKKYLERITPDNVQGEYYLTDLVKLAIEGGERVIGYKTDNVFEIAGINSPEDFSKAEKIIARRYDDSP